MSSIIFSHKKEIEKEYLDQLLEEKEWFESENFDVFLPDGKNSPKKPSEDKNDSLNQKIFWLKDEWKKIEESYFKIVKSFQHTKLLSSYQCHISLFGPEGKYTPPDMLFVRLRTNRDKQRVIETIAHELLHLIFADFFESKKLNYVEIEGMIDALIVNSDLAQLFPQYEIQSIGKVRPNLLKDILQ